MNFEPRFEMSKNVGTGTAVSYIVCDSLVIFLMDLCNGTRTELPATERLIPF